MIRSFDLLRGRCRCGTLPDRASAVLGCDGLRASKEGTKRKTLHAKECRRVSEISGKLYVLFSSFLRGASCPKSPRFAAASGTSINDRDEPGCQEHCVVGSGSVSEFGRLLEQCQRFGGRLIVCP